MFINFALSSHCREEAGLFGRRAGFKFSVKKLNDIQSKVEGWEVNK